jgi:hypothetical protein
MKYKLTFITFFLSIHTFTAEYVFLSSSPDSFSEILGSTIKKEIYAEEDFIEFSLDEQISCLEEGL